MSNGNNRSFIALEMMFEPCHGFRIQMVCRLIKEEDVGFSQQQTAEGYPPFLTAGQNIDQRVGRRTAQGIHGHVKAGIKIPAIQRVQFFLNLTLTGNEIVHLIV